MKGPQMPPRRKMVDKKRYDVINCSECGWPMLELESGKCEDCGKPLCDACLEKSDRCIACEHERAVEFAGAL